MKELGFECDFVKLTRDKTVRTGAVTACDQSSRSQHAAELASGHTRRDVGQVALDAGG